MRKFVLRAHTNILQIPIYIIGMTSFFIPELAVATDPCRVEIRVNDSKAIIFFNGEFIRSSHYFLECRNTDQIVVVMAPNKKPFVRTIPKIEDFSEYENFWNVRLQSYADHLPANQILDLSTVSTEVGELKMGRQARTAEFPFTVARNLTSIINPVKTEMGPIKVNWASSVSLQKAEQKETPELIRMSKSIEMSEVKTKKINHFEAQLEKSMVQMFPLKGLFVQIPSVAASEATKGLVIERLKSVQKKLVGIDITFCDTRIVPSSLLLGPVETVDKAWTLAKLLGQNSVIVRDPVCESNAKLNFHFGKGS